MKAVATRKNFFNEHYFKEIDTEDKSYWLGFLMADGYVTRTSPNEPSPNRLGLGISESDREHLDKFIQAINYHGNVIIDRSGGTYGSDTPLNVLHLNSRVICNDIISHGCKPNKTGYSSLPDLSDELMPHFIRGYFDGDGSISVYYQKDHRNPKYADRMKQEFAITSDFNIISQIQQILVEQCSLPETKLKSYKRTESAVSVRYGGKQQVLRIYYYLYQNATVYLQRKYDKFALLLS